MGTVLLRAGLALRLSNPPALPQSACATPNVVSSLWPSWKPSSLFPQVAPVNRVVGHLLVRVREVGQELLEGLAVLKRRLDANENLAQVWRGAREEKRQQWAERSLERG